MLVTFRDDTIQSQLGHLQIVRPGYHNVGKADPYRFLLPAGVPRLESDHRPQQIKVIAPRLSFNGLISHADSTLSFIADGVSPQAEAAFGRGVQITAGEKLSGSEPMSVIIGVGLARNLGVSVGDKVVLLANTASGGTNGVELSVRGLFSTVSKAYDDVALQVPIDTARELLRTQGSHVWVVLLHDTADTDNVLFDLRAKLSEGQFEVVPWYKLADIYNKTARLFNKQAEGLRFMLALIILLSILNTVTMNVMERTGEIGTCMALGVKRGAILRLFVTEGVLMGCIGGVLGVAIGAVLAAVVSAIGIPMPPPPGVTHGYTSAVVVTPKIALESFVLALVTTFAASVYPAWRASRKEIVDALRHNR
jgi:putative ABC transport system permease protein